MLANPVAASSAAGTVTVVDSDTTSAAKIAWLREHAARLSSFDPADVDFRDLEPIGAAIGDARVVFLGDPSHGTGNIFSGQTRLVKFLHEKKGFDVLIFESGLFDLTKVWQAIGDGHPTLDAFRQGIFGIWTTPAEMRPLAEYVGEQSRGRRPLELAGYDEQFSGTASRDKLVPELQAYISGLRIKGAFIGDSALWEGFRRIHPMVTPSNPADTLPPDRATQTRFLDRLAELRMAIGARSDDDRSQFWQRVLEGTAVFAQAQWQRPETDSNWDGFNARDEQGARNLVWLADHRYRGRKVIVWLATVHAGRNMAGIDTRKSTFNYALVRTTGHYAWKAFGREMYSLGFVALEGESGRRGQRWPIVADQQPEAELEEMLGAAGFNFAFLDYRHIPVGGNWLRAPFVSRPFGNSAMMGPWREVMDGIVFVRKGMPTTVPVGVPKE